MSIDDEVKVQITKYEALPGGKELLEYIRSTISKHGNMWDKGLQNGSDELLTMLLFEYATGVSKVTGGQIDPRFVIEKISGSLEIFRFGDFKKGLDDAVTYGTKVENGTTSPLSVTDEEYTINTRVRKNFGAHAPTFTNSNGERKNAIVLFDDKQLLPNGRRLSGINLSSLYDIRHTVFHELTHIMEKNRIPRKDLSNQDIVFDKGELGSLFINYEESPDYNGLGYYIQSMNDAINNRDSIVFNGISTIEINPNKSSNRIMRNQISEGATEFISNLVMVANGIEMTEESKKRYLLQKEIIRRVFSHRGLGNSVTDYFTDSRKLINYMESIKVGDKDFLHYASDFLDMSDDMGRDISDHTSLDKTKSEKLFNMYTLLSHGSITEQQKKMYRALIMQELINSYNGRQDGKNAFAQRIRDRLDFAEEFGNVLDANFPIRPDSAQGDSSIKREDNNDDGR